MEATWADLPFIFSESAVFTKAYDSGRSDRAKVREHVASGANQSNNRSLA
jgi:hypothetical protein